MGAVDSMKQDSDREKINQIFREGTFARALGRSSDSNPHPVNSREAGTWEKGWRLVDGSPKNASNGSLQTEPTSSLEGDQVWPPNGAPALIRYSRTVFVVCAVAIAALTLLIMEFEYR
jgi:hypothetical protein